MMLKKKAYSFQISLEHSNVEGMVGVVMSAAPGKREVMSAEKLAIVDCRSQSVVRKYN
jgi:hypothetical protein